MIHNLQALRAVAAWMVVAHHLRAPLGEVWAPLGDTLIFAAGVDIFFVLSGYVMVVSTRSSPSATEFLRRRAVRILPLYWAVTLAITITLIFGLHPIGISSWSWTDVAQSFLLVGAERSDGYAGPLLGVGWTLAYEAFFYALIGAALLLGAPIMPALPLALAGLVVLGAVNGEGFAARFYTSPILLEFAAGMMIAHLRLLRFGPALCSTGVAALFVGGYMMAQVAPSGDLITPGGDGAIWRTVLFGVPAVLIISGAVAWERAGGAVRAGFIRDQGDASYALYLIHLPLIQIIDKAVGSTLLLLITPPVLAISAHAIHQGWERPVLAILRPRRFDLRIYRLVG